MELFQTMLKRAQEYKKAGENHKSLELYNDAFNFLVAEAAEFARVETGSLPDGEALRSIAPFLLAHSKAYLMRDLTAASVLNAMGILFEELGDFENAKQKFTESIEYTPPGTIFDDPVHNLDSITSRVIQTAALEHTDE